MLSKHPWPGNIRELAKACEQFSQSSSGIIDESTIRSFFQSKHSSGLETLDWVDYVFQHGLNSYIAQIEKKAVEEALRRNQGKITACIRDLRISSSAFYRILQENQLKV